VESEVYRLEGNIRLFGQIHLIAYYSKWYIHAGHALIAGAKFGNASKGKTIEESLTIHISPHLPHPVDSGESVGRE
jgi:hypothetical protein